MIINNEPVPIITQSKIPNTNAFGPDFLSLLKVIPHPIKNIAPTNVLLAIS